MKRTLSVILSLTLVAVFFSGCAEDKTSADSDSFDSATIKGILMKNTEYVEQHLPGIWISSDGVVGEYSDGWSIGYSSVYAYGGITAESENAVREAMSSIGYDRYSISNPESYDENELLVLQIYARQLQNKNDAGSFAISVNNYLGFTSGDPLFHEFTDDDTMIVEGKTTFTRVTGADTNLSNSITGFYINGEDNLAIIQKSKTEGLYEWYHSAGVLNGQRDVEFSYGNCEISSNQIRLIYKDVRGETSVTVIQRDDEGSLKYRYNTWLEGQEITRESTYEKISDLTYIAQAFAGN